MGQLKTPGLIKRGGIWHIDKVIRGTRVCESTGTRELRRAEEQLAQRINDVREASVFGLRADHTFRAAATKFLNENQHQRRIRDGASQLKQLDPFIGATLLRQVHIGAPTGIYREPKKGRGQDEVDQSRSGDCSTGSQSRRERVV
jgi:hypothetical protein